MPCSAGFETFKFDVIEQVSSGTINFVKEKPIKSMGVFLGVYKKFLECLALVPLAGSFGDPKHLDDLAANSINVLAQSIFLNVEGKSLTLLLSTAHPSKGHESLCHVDLRNIFNDLNYRRKRAQSNGEHHPASKSSNGVLLLVTSIFSSSVNFTKMISRIRRLM